MKKFMILAISAVLVANVSAHEQKQECKGKQLTKEERVEMEIRRFTQELYLSDEQAAKFAVTYRDYVAELDKLLPKHKCHHGQAEQTEQAEPSQQMPPKELTDKDLDKMAKERLAKQREILALKESFYDKFRQDLSARQVEKVLRLNEPFGPKPCCGKCEGHGTKPGFEAPKHGFEFAAPHPEQAPKAQKKASRK